MTYGRELRGKGQPRYLILKDNRFNGVQSCCFVGIQVMQKFDYYVSRNGDVSHDWEFAV